MDVVFLKTVWLYLPDGSRERIIAQTGDNDGIGFDSVHAGVEVRRYFRYNNYSITQTEKGDYVVSPVDDEHEKIYYPNGTYEYVSKVVPHDGFWEVHVRRNSFCEWRVDCWGRRHISLKRKHDGWYWRRIDIHKSDLDCESKFVNGPVCFRASDSYYARVRKICRYFTGEWCIWYEGENGGEEFFSFDERNHELALCDNVIFVTPKSSGGESDVNGSEIIHPSHYATLNPEPITFIRDQDYLAGSALKYIFRASHKNGADENIDMGKAAWYLRELVNEQGGQTVIAILRGVYWDTIDRQLTPEKRAREVRDRLTEFMTAISHDHLSDYIPEEK